MQLLPRLVLDGDDMDLAFRLLDAIQDMLKLRISLSLAEVPDQLVRDEEEPYRPGLGGMAGLAKAVDSELSFSNLFQEFLDKGGLLHDPVLLQHLPDFLPVQH